MSDNWEPIETAPKDGTPVLLEGGDISMEFTSIAPHPVVAVWAETDWGMAWVAHHGLYSTVLVQGPSHWLSIPPAPIAARIIGHREAA